jgi:hypothetical protein
MTIEEGAVGSIAAAEEIIAGLECELVVASAELRAMIVERIQANRRLIEQLELILHQAPSGLTVH